MNILVVGLGSIGKRHLDNIQMLGYKGVSVVSRRGLKLEGSPDISVYTTVQEALQAAQFGAAVVCTPTAFHLEALYALLEAKVPKIYIEKPISHTLDGIGRLVALASEYKSRTIVGYDLHFDPGLLKVRQPLAEGVIGSIVSVNAQVGQFLPDWRPHEDYRQGMSAKRETGGGVMLDLVHEFDYLYWLFGKVAHIACFCKNSGALEIETEDVADVLLKFENGIAGTIHLDYLQQKLVRNCLITGSKGSILWNLALSEVKWIDIDKTEHTFSYSDFARNDRFLGIMRAFLEGQQHEGLTSLADGLESLKMVIAAKEAATTQRVVDMQTIKIQ